jgi:hypothetical protein
MRWTPEPAARRRRLGAARLAALQALVSGRFRARDLLATAPADAAARMARREGLGAGQLAEALREVEFPDRAANLEQLRPETGTLAPALRRLAAVMVRKRLVDREPTPPALDDTYLGGTRP